MKIASDMRRTRAGRLARNVLVALAAATFAVSFSSAGERSEPPSETEANSFDAPIKKVIIDFGPSRQFDDPGDMRTTLTCYYYPHLMIKEYDDWSPGAALSMLYSQGKLPACNHVRQRGERLLDDGLGYLKGVKDALVFFEAGEAFNGELVFDVYDSVSGKKIFEDSAYFRNRVQVMPTKDGYLLKYLRVEFTDCNLHSEGMDCWKKIEAEFELKSGRPVCTGYDHIAELVGTDDVESVIAYPVEVSLFPRPTVEALPGATKCWPQQ